MAEFFNSLSPVLLFITIYFLRIIDVSLSVIRTIAVVKGKVVVSFILGFFEVSVWLIAVSQALAQINHRPFLIISYALGFASGNAIGIILERYLITGVVRVAMSSYTKSSKLISTLRESGFVITTMEAKDLQGNKTILSCVCLRKKLKSLLRLAKSVDPSIVYTVGTLSGYSDPYSVGTRRNMLGYIFNKK